MDEGFATHDIDFFLGPITSSRSTNGHSRSIGEQTTCAVRNTTPLEKIGALLHRSSTRWSITTVPRSSVSDRVDELETCVFEDPHQNPIVN